MKMIGNVSDWLSYAGGALIKVADSAVSTVVQRIQSILAILHSWVCLALFNSLCMIELTLTFTRVTALLL